MLHDLVHAALVNRRQGAPATALVLCREIVRAHGGWLALERREEGARVWLPTVEDNARPET